MFQAGEVLGMLLKVRPRIIRASKVIIEVGAYDELPTEVVNLPDESEYRCCLADMVPDGELEHGGVCDKGVNTDPVREVDCRRCSKQRDKQGGGNKRRTQGHTRTANWSEPK